MTPGTLEERVSALEETVSRLAAIVNVSKRDEDWRSTIGMFEGDAVISAIQEEGRKIRKAERRVARQDAEP